MAFKMKGWSAFKQDENDEKDRKQALKELASKWAKGDEETRDSIANLDYVGGDFMEYFRKEAENVNYRGKKNNKK
tara:strand:- start:47 stop:271 length:225 start_codon:yes stop_codon:yes gene_type:complete